jgi:hypothetical protein
MKISFINAIANISESVGADIEQIDGRNLYATDRMTGAGLIYYSVGRAVGVPEPMSSIARHRDAGLHLPLPTVIHPAVAG